jgi:hypothetical protein
MVEDSEYCAQRSHSQAGSGLLEERCEALLPEGSALLERYLGLRLYCPLEALHVCRAQEERFCSRRLRVLHLADSYAALLPEGCVLSARPEHCLAACHLLSAGAAHLVDFPAAFLHCCHWPLEDGSQFSGESVPPADALPAFRHVWHSRQDEFQDVG